MSHFSIVNEILPMLDFFLYNVIFPVLHYFFSVTIVSVQLINLKFWFWKFSAFSVTSSFTIYGHRRVKAR